jgi:hypothetical protein
MNSSHTAESVFFDVPKLPCKREAGSDTKKHASVNSGGPFTRFLSSRQGLLPGKNLTLCGGGYFAADWLHTTFADAAVRSSANSSSFQTLAWKQS